jgi:hypothetical protein
MNIGPAKRKESESYEEYKLRRKLDKMLEKVKLRFGRLFWDSLNKGTYHANHEKNS